MTDQAEVNTRTMSAVDAALEPVERLAASPGPMNTAQLRTVVTAFRQAIALLVNGVPEPVAPVEDPAPEAPADEGEPAESVFG